MSDIFKTNLETLKVSINTHLRIFREQLDESAEKLKEHKLQYGDYFYRTDDNPPKTTELVMQSSLKDLRLQMKTALEIIEIVDRINKNAKDSSNLSSSSDSETSKKKPFDPEKWMKEAADDKKDNQDGE